RKSGQEVKGGLMRVVVLDVPAKIPIAFLNGISIPYQPKISMQMVQNLIRGKSPVVVQHGIGRNLVPLESVAEELKGEIRPGKAIDLVQECTFFHAQASRKNNGIASLLGQFREVLPRGQEVVEQL